MCNHLKRGFIPLFLFLFTFAASAQELENHIQRLSLTPLQDGFQVSLGIDQPELAELDDNEPVELFQFGDGIMLEEPGRPVVPLANGLFRLPPHGGVQVSVLDSSFHLVEIDNYAHLLTELDDGTYGAMAEGVDEWYPSSLVSTDVPAIFHDFRVTTMSVFPVQVNTAQGLARVYDSLDLQVDYNGEDERNALPSYPTMISEAFLPWYRLFIDWDDAELDEYQLYHGHAQVIMQDNPTLFSLMEDWFEWKRQKGWVLETLTSSDIPQWNSASIEQELQTRWNEAEAKFDYIVIVGDNVGPFSTPVANLQGDFQYGLLAGDDNLLDVGIGRISIESSQQLTAYINKVLSYERDPNLDDLSWYTRGQVAAGSSVSGISTIFNGRYVRHLALEHGYSRVDTAWYNDGHGSVNSRSVNRINNGVSYYNYRGLQGTGLNTHTINSLVNDRKLPMIIDITCGTGTWAHAYSITEAYMRAGTVNIPRGAIGAIGTALTYTHTRFNNALAGGAAFASFELNATAAGDVFRGAQFNLWMNFHQFDPAGVNNFSEWANLMGDPLVWTWTDAPRELVVEANDTLSLGQHLYEVQVSDAEGSVHGAWVTLYTDDQENHWVAHLETDDNGIARLAVEPAAPGEAQLTVTMKNHAPVRRTIEIVQPDERVALSDVSILDDGTLGTMGDGDGHADAGETVGLMMNLRNYGNVEQTNLSLSISSEDPWILGIEGEIDIAELAVNENIQPDEIVLVTISPEAQDSWVAELEVSIDSDQGHYDDHYFLGISAPHYALVANEITGELAPGSEAELVVQIANVGHRDGSISTLLLQSTDRYLTIIDSTSDLSALTVGETARSSSFLVGSPNTTFNGHIGSARLILTGADGFQDTVTISLVIGNIRPEDPFGPDQYGYFAYESWDSDYPIAPVYNWIEINQDEPEFDFPGTLLPINDVQGGDRNLATVIQLPFPVTYYGEEYHEITISSNGFLALGSQADMSLQRNWAIPSPLGPSAMIAPYWDDRYLPTGESGVYFFNDLENGRFIVQFDHLLDAQGRNGCTFEVILFEYNEDHTTPTGDNEILFQYETMEHSYGRNTDVPYWTTGIENQNQTVGLMLNYWNIPIPGNRLVADSSAILFTTRSELASGNLRGQVLRQEDQQPMEGVFVHTPTNRFSQYTDENGNFFLEDLLIGQYDLIAELPGYNILMAENVSVEEGDTAFVGFTMTHPEISVEPESIDIELRPGYIWNSILTIRNDGSGPLEFSQNIQLEAPAGGELVVPGENELDDPWDSILQFDLPDIESRNRAVTYDGENFWVAGSNNLDNDTPNKLYRYDRSGELLATYDQPVEDFSNVGFRDLETDGEFLYGIDNNVVHIMQIFEDQVALRSTINVPITPVSLITVDPESGLIWLANNYGPIYSINRDGALVQRIDVNPYARGMAWDESEGDGFNLYFICQTAGEDEIVIRKLNPETQELREVNRFLYPEALFGPSGASISLDYNPLVRIIMSVMDNGARDHVQLWELDLNSAWLDLSMKDGTVAASSEQQITLTFDSYMLPENVYRVWLEVDHNAAGDAVVIPITMTVTQVINDVADADPERVLEWRFDGAYPNPFNSATQISFTLKEAVPVTLLLYNSLGQEVGELYHGSLEAGVHRFYLDSEGLANGIYFLKMDGGPIHETKKILLLK